MRHTVTFILLCCFLGAAAAVPYETLAERADRSYQWREWASAAALYELMLDRRPEVPESYARAIVATEMIPDTTSSTVLMERAMQHGIAIDSLLVDVRAESFAQSEPGLYPAYLMRLHRRLPWMRRALDHELLTYYVFRNDGPNMVKYARVMLEGLPDSPEFLSILARGHMLQGQLDDAAAIWQKILTAAPDNYEALTYLACYWRERGDETAAAPYVERASAIRPSPFLTPAR